MKPPQIKQLRGQLNLPRNLMLLFVSDIRLTRVARDRNYFDTQPFQHIFFCSIGATSFEAVSISKLFVVFFCVTAVLRLGFCLH